MRAVLKDLHAGIAAMSKHGRELDALRSKIDQLERLQSQPPALGRTFMAGIGALLASIIISVSSPFANYVLQDDPNACAIQYSSISSALKAGIDDDDTLAPLAEEGCAVTPKAVADDIRDSSAEVLPGPSAP
jgi:hypothetical protein